MSEAVQIKFGVSGISESIAQIKSLQGQFLDLAKSLAAPILGVASVAGIIEMTKAAIDGGAQLEKLSKQTDLSVKSLAGIKHAADEVGEPFDKFNSALSIFTQRTDAALRQGGSAAKTFRDLGVALTDSSGSARSMDSILKDTIDSLNKVSGQQRAADMKTLFGRGSADLIPVFGQGSDAVLNGAPAGSEEFAKAAEETERAWNKVKAVWDSVFRQFAAQILPALKAGADELLDWQKNSDIAGKAVEYLKDAFYGVVFTVGLVKNIFETIANLLATDWTLAVDSANIGIEGLIKLAQLWWESFKLQYDLLGDLIKRLLSLGEIMGDIATGHISDAWSKTKDLFTGTISDFANAGKRMANVVKDAYRTVVDTGSREIGLHKELIGGFLKDTKEQYVNWWDGFVNKIGEFEAKANTVQVTPGSGKDSKPVAEAVPYTDEGKKLIDKINQMFAQSFESRIALLNLEEATLKQKADEEIHDVTLREQEKARIEAVYSQKRADLQRKEADQRLSISEGELKNQMTLID